MIPIFTSRQEVLSFYEKNPNDRSMIRNPETNESLKVSNIKQALKALNKLKIK